MAKAIADLRVSLTAMTSRFTGPLKAARGPVNDLSKTISVAHSSIAKFGGLLGVSLGGASLIADLRSTITEIDALAKTADRLSIDISTLERLRFAAKRSGVEVSTLDSVIRRLGKRTAEAARGTGAAQGAFQMLGLDAKRLAAQAPDKILLEIAGAMERVGIKGNDALLVAQGLFDADGVQLLNLLQQGEAGVRALFDRFDELDGGISRLDAASIERVNDSLADMKTSANAAWREIALKLAPALEDGFNSITNRVIESKGEVGKFERALLQAEAAAFNFARLPFAFGAQLPGAPDSTKQQALEFEKQIDDAEKRLRQAKVQDIVGLPDLNFSGLNDALDKLKEAKQADGGGSLFGGGEEAAKKFEESKKRLEQLRELAKTPEQLFADAKKEIAAFSLFGGLEPEETARLLQQATKHYEDLSGETERLNKEQEELARIFEDIQSPIDRYSEKVDRLLDLYNDTKLNADQLGAAVRGLNQDLLASLNIDVQTPIDRFNEYLDTLSQVRDLGLINDEQFGRNAEGARESALSSLGLDLSRIETPFERHAKSMDSLRKAFASGLLSDEEANRFANMFSDELQRDLDNQGNERDRDLSRDTGEFGQGKIALMGFSRGIGASASFPDFSSALDNSNMRPVQFGKTIGDSFGGGVSVAPARAQDVRAPQLERTNELLNAVVDTLRNRGVEVKV